MTFNSITFAFIFLPASLLLYYIVPRRIKSFVLVLLSLLFYAWGDIRYLLLLLFSMAFNYLAALEIYGWRNRGFEEKAKATKKVFTFGSASAQSVPVQEVVNEEIVQEPVMEESRVEQDYTPNNI